MAHDGRTIEVMIVQATLDPELPLDLAERLRGAMTVRALVHGAQALRMIEEGVSPDIILLDRRTPGVDVTAMRRVLQMRAATRATTISFIDGERALFHDDDAGEPIALLHGLRSAQPPAAASTLHEDTDRKDEQD